MFCLAPYNQQSGFKEGRSVGTDEGLNSGFSVGLTRGAQEGFAWGQLWGLERYFNSFPFKSFSSFSAWEAQVSTSFKIDEKRELENWQENHQKELQRIQDLFTRSGQEKPVCYNLQTVEEPRL